MSSSLKQISSLSEQEKVQFIKHVFPKLEASEIELFKKDFLFCLSSDASKEIAFTYAEILKANQWLKSNGYCMVRLQQELTN